MRVGTQAVLAFFFVSCASVFSLQAQLYVGVMGGVATLSGDNSSSVGQNSSFSSYDPKNGPAIEVFVGEHLSEYFTVQGQYVWNSNTLLLTSADFSNGEQQGYKESRSSTQQAVIADLLVYFRKRNSRLRPFLSVGTGFVHLSSSQQSVETLLGSPVLPPQSFSSNQIVLHVPVGLDVKLAKGWVFRYTFSETISSNPISKQLSPPASHRLQNFQNLFGILYQF